MPEAVTGQHALCGVRLRRAHRQHDSAHLVRKPTSGYSLAALPPGLERERPWAEGGHCSDPTCIMMFLCLRSCCDRAMRACMGRLQQLPATVRTRACFPCRLGCLLGWAASAGVAAERSQCGSVILGITLIPNLLLYFRVLGFGAGCWTRGPRWGTCCTRRAARCRRRCCAGSLASCSWCAWGRFCEQAVSVQRMRAL